MKDNDIKHAVSLLRQGSLVAIPTETVYGLAADAKNPDAVAKIFAAKGRPKTNPLIIHLSHIDAISEWAINIPDEAFQLGSIFWPGPLTLILPKHPSVPLITTGQQETVGLRIPNHPLTLKLLQEFDGGLAAPSANRYQHLSPTTAQHVLDDLDMKVDYILDGGPCSLGIESTIVSLVDKEPQILRLGAISKEALEQVLNQKLSLPKNAGIQVPGSDRYHYAPIKPLYLLSVESFLPTVKSFLQEQKKISVLTFQSAIPEITERDTWLHVDFDAAEYAMQLYARLRALDANDSELILVEAPPKKDVWLAILDRLKRASVSATIE